MAAKYGKKIKVTPAVGQRWILKSKRGEGLLEITKVDVINDCVNGKFLQMTKDFVLYTDDSWGHFKDSSGFYTEHPKLRKLEKQLLLCPSKPYSPQINPKDEWGPETAWVYLPGQEAPAKVKGKKRG